MNPPGRALVESRLDKGSWESRQKGEQKRVKDFAVTFFTIPLIHSTNSQ
jgi:hypothetical protein